LANSNSRHVLFFFMSIHPRGIKGLAAKRRIADYAQSIRQTSNFLNGRDWKIIFCDNTLQPDDLDEFVYSSGASGNFLNMSVEQNLGQKNKGLGELDMLTRGAERFKNILDAAETISYFTGRHLMTNLYLIEKTESLKRKALISNPNFIGLDGRLALASEQPGLINDMFFSMKSQELFRYIEYFKALIGNSVDVEVGSEQILHSFIVETGIEYEWLPALGILRREEVLSRLLRLSQQRWDII
jgi:hypothetical protein